MTLKANNGISEMGLTGSVSGLEKSRCMGYLMNGTVSVDGVENILQLVTCAPSYARVAYGTRDTKYIAKVGYKEQSDAEVSFIKTSIVRASQLWEAISRNTTEEGQNSLTTWSAKLVDLQSLELRGQLNKQLLSSEMVIYGMIII